MKIYFLLVTAVALAGAFQAKAAVSCGGPLSAAQAEGFGRIFSPEYLPALTNVGKNASSDIEMSKKMRKSDVIRFTSKPRVAATSVLTAENAKFLRDALNANAQKSVPGWIATAIGIPNALVGITADVAIQLVNASGDTGRLSLANLAGKVETGGKIGVIETVSRDPAGPPKFVYFYTHTTQMDGREIQTLLRVCKADIIEE